MARTRSTWPRRLARPGLPVTTAALVVMFAVWLVSHQTGPGTASESLAKLDLPGLATLFPRGEAFEYEPPVAGSYDLPAIKPMPDSVLIDSNGEPVTLSAIAQGRQSLIAFVYLNCADAEGCPLAMATLWQLHDGSARKPALSEQLQLITISFDPERDTPEALNAIVHAMQADRQLEQKLPWHFLTGPSRQALEPLLKAFGQPVQASQTPGKMNHLLRLFLVDRHGQIRNVYGLGSIDPRLIMSDVATLLMQDNAPL